MAETNTAPSPNFSTIDFNPSFFTTSTSLTVDEADSLYLSKIVPDTALGLETFSGGIQSTTATITSTLDVLGLLTVNTVDSIGSTLTLGSSNATKVTTNLPFSASSFDSTGSTLTLGVTNATTVTTALPFYANSYYLTGTAPTLSKSSMNYFVNCGVVSSGTLTTLGTRYLYSPASNGSTGSSNYFNAGVYEANIHAYVAEANGPTITGCTLVLALASGQTTGTLSTTSQYGSVVASSSSPTFSSNNNAGLNLNGFGTGFSHTFCFTLTTSAFVNLQLTNVITTITAGNITFQVYGVIKRIA
jgi:hypothetical protein